MLGRIHGVCLQNSLNWGWSLCASGLSKLTGYLSSAQWFLSWQQMMWCSVLLIAHSVQRTPSVALGDLTALFLSAEGLNLLQSAALSPSRKWQCCCDQAAQPLCLAAKTAAALSPSVLSTGRQDSSGLSWGKLLGLPLTVVFWLGGRHWAHCHIRGC